MTETPLSALAQPGLLEPVPAHARYLELQCLPSADPAQLRAALQRLQAQVDGRAVVLGLGHSLLARLCGNAQGPAPAASGEDSADPADAATGGAPARRALAAVLCEMPAFEGSAVPLPATPVALWLWLRGPHPGDVVLRSLALLECVADAFAPLAVVDAFRHGDPQAAHGRDLSGYEDGTENPQGEDAVAAALCAMDAPGLRGGSCVAVQQWWHDMAALGRLDMQAQDHAIGRRRSDNGELEDAPPNAHVRRTAQEDFRPEAFVLRRSMPWASAQGCGLYFVACGRDFAAFEAQMRRMAGLDDGVVDALFGFTRPRSGAYLWCPPLHQGRVDLRPLGVH